MDLFLSESERRFRDDLREWLAANVPREPLADWRESADETNFEKLRAWEQELYEGGWAAVAWPREYGGRGASHVEQAIFGEEYARAGAPPRVNDLGAGVVGPTLIEFGTEEQRRRFLPPLLRAEEIWCQGFSEPEAGSDLAAVKTRAVRSGGELVVSGQKVWTSLARFADWMYALVTTQPEVRHRGLTCLLIDMRSPGVTVKPLVQITGDPQFGEVFFSEVRVPRENVVGEVDKGWRIAMASLGYDRAAALGNHATFRRTWERVFELSRQVDDPVIRHRVAQAFVEVEVFRLMSYRAATRLGRHRVPGPEASVAKLYWSEMNCRLQELALDILGPAAELAPSAPEAVDGGRWPKTYLYARAGTIYAGTSEIQKNIIAQRLLGLPRVLEP